MSIIAMSFLVVLKKEEGSNYTATVPDLPGCTSSGDGVIEVIDNVKSAILLHLENMKEEEIEVLSVSTHLKLLGETGHLGGIWISVAVPFQRVTG